MQHKSMRLKITQEDIEHGVKCNAIFCPIARALRRKFGTAHIWVTYATIVVDQEIWRVSESLRAWINAYDNGLPVKPQTFKLARIG